MTTALFILLCLFWFCVLNRRPRLSSTAPPLDALRFRHELEFQLDERQRERDERYRHEKYEREDRWFQEDMAHARLMAEERSRAAHEQSRRSMEAANEAHRITMDYVRRKGRLA